MTPTARSVAALVRATIGAGNASCTTRTAGVILVVVTGNADRTVDREALARSIAAAAIREGWDASRTGEVLTITGGEPVEQTAAEPAVEAFHATASTIAAAAGPAALLDRLAARRDRTAEEDGTDGLVHLMSDDLLDACGAAGPGGLHLAPSTTPERITCPACLPLVEADVPPTAEERVTVPIRASELRPGDEVVDSLGNRQYAAFDVQQVPATFPGGDGLTRVWTAVRDQEAGLPPVITVNGRRELLVLRPLSEEGRELLAALDRVQV